MISIEELQWVLAMKEYAKAEKERHSQPNPVMDNLLWKRLIKTLGRNPQDDIVNLFEMILRLIEIIERGTVGSELTQDKIDTIKYLTRKVRP